MKILFFIDSLKTGGCERRLVELLYYLKMHTDFKLCLVLTEPMIDYEYVKDLKIPIHIIKRKLIKYDPSLFFKFYSIAKSFKPDIIHTWSRMTTFYACPTKLIMKKILLANLIADSKKKYKRFSLSNLFFQIDIIFSDVILGNSKAGFKAYNLVKNKKKSIIYNGVRLDRFLIQTDAEKLKNELGINTPYIIIMVASASKNKNYDLLLDVAKSIGKIRKDVCFLGVGDGAEKERLDNRVMTEGIKNIKLIGKRNDIESLIDISNMGLLFSYSEGISNSIIEYMGMGKPVITTDIFGGSKELIEDGFSGYIMASDVEKITNKINKLLSDPLQMEQLGIRGRNIIKKKFSIEKMGEEYKTLYYKYKCYKNNFKNRGKIVTEY